MTMEPSFRDKGVHTNYDMLLNNERDVAAAATPWGQKISVCNWPTWRRNPGEDDGQSVKETFEMPSSRAGNDLVSNKR